MRRLLFILAILLLIASTWIGLTEGQIEPIKRNIVYAHVPNSVCALLCFVVLLVASIGCLVTARPDAGNPKHEIRQLPVAPCRSGNPKQIPNGRKLEIQNGTPGRRRRFGHLNFGHWDLFRISNFGFRIWDLVAVAAAEVGFVFATILNATGMLFSRAEWNVWWTPSPRLVSSAILWFLYAVYLILRVSLPGSQYRRARICAVFGIIGFLDVPLVFISARFLPDIHRPNFSFDSAWQTAALMLGMAGTVVLAGALIWLRTSLLRDSTKLEEELLHQR